MCFLCIIVHLLFPTTSAMSRSFPFTLQASLLQENLSPLAPSRERKRSFKEMTGEPFKAPIITYKGDSCTISCPLCPESEPILVPWCSPDGRSAGYGERFFQGLCNQGGIFNAEVSTYSDSIKIPSLYLTVIIDNGCEKVCG